MIHPMEVRKSGSLYIGHVYDSLGGCYVRIISFGHSIPQNPISYGSNLFINVFKDAAQDDGTALMRPIVGLRHGDTVGVAVQQSDLPMVQFLLNGEPLHDIAINRFRGSVFPAVYVQGELSVTAVFDETSFKEMSPHVRFGPLIAARGII